MKNHEGLGIKGQARGRAQGRSPLALFGILPDRPLFTFSFFFLFFLLFIPRHWERGEREREREVVQSEMSTEAARAKSSGGLNTTRGKSKRGEQPGRTRLPSFLRQKYARARARSRRLGRDRPRKVNEPREPPPPPSEKGGCRCHCSAARAKGRALSRARCNRRATHPTLRVLSSKQTKFPASPTSPYVRRSLIRLANTFHARTESQVRLADSQGKKMAPRDTKKNFRDPKKKKKNLKRVRKGFEF